MCGLVSVHVCSVYSSYQTISLYHSAYLDYMESYKAAVLLFLNYLLIIRQSRVSEAPQDTVPDNHRWAYKFAFTFHTEVIDVLFEWAKKCLFHKVSNERKTVFLEEITSHVFYYLKVN